jgi:hypothetical protein
MTWQVPAGTENAIAERARSQSSGEASGKAPYQFQDVYNPQTGQMEHVPVSEMAGGSLNQHYGVGGAQGGTPGGGHFAAAPPLGQQSARHLRQGLGERLPRDTGHRQQLAAARPVAARDGEPHQWPRRLNTGPTRARMQSLAEEHGLSFLANDNAFVFNKDAARFVAQSAQDLGLNGSDARLGMMANASPNMKMTPQALHVVIPTMIGLEYAKMAKATAAASWAQRSPGTNAQFESQWRQNYDPRMFTAYAQGGPQALAKAPAKLRQQWLNDYRNSKGWVSTSPSSRNERVRSDLRGDRAKYNLPPGILKATAQVESHFNPKAVSPQGAEGLMQVMPATAASLGVDPHDVPQAIDGAGRLWAQNLKASNGDIDRAAMMYHGGPDTHQWGPKTHAYPAKLAAALGPQPQQEGGDPIEAALSGQPTPAPSSQAAPQASSDPTDPIESALSGSGQDRTAEIASAQAQASKLMASGDEKGAIATSRSTICKSRPASWTPCTRASAAPVSTTSISCRRPRRKPTRGWASTRADPPAR